MRIAIVVIALACGSSGALAGQRADVVSGLDFGEIRWDRDKGTLTGTVNGPVDSAYRVLRGFVKELNLTVKSQDDDPANHEFMVRRVRLVNQLGKERVSKYLSCGEGMTGPNADSWHVYLTIATALTPAGPGKSKLQMALTAEAIDVPGGRNDRVACASTGVLEQDIAARLRDSFGGSTGK
jgi:hypothetical protein